MSVSRVKIHLLSWLLVLDFLGGARLKRWLWLWRRRSPAKREVCIPADGKNLSADLYCDPYRPKSAAVLLTHGVIEHGKDDQRLHHFAECLVVCGFSVLIPELRQMKSLTLDMEESRDIVHAFRFMLELRGIDRARAGLLGFSFGAGPTLRAAAEPAIREQVKFVVVFGGYFDPVNVIRYLTTGSDTYQGYRHAQEPGPYGKRVFVCNIVRHAADANDRLCLEQLFEGSLETEPQRDHDRRCNLTPGGRALYDLIVNKDGARVEPLLDRTDGTVKAYLRSLSLRDVIHGVKAHVFIGHGDADSLMPSTESLRLAAALPPKSLGYVAVIKVVGHVDPSKSRIALRELLTAFLPALLRFHALFRRILDQRAGDQRTEASKN